MDLDRCARELADLAARAASREELRRETIARLERAVGFDAAIVWRLGDESATLSGFDQGIWDRYRAQLPRYAPDVARLLEAAAARRGVARDTDVLARCEREASPFYADIIRPAGSGGFLTAVLEVRGRRIAALQLGRASRRGPIFRLGELEPLRALLPCIALGEAIFAPSAPSPRAELGARENEIVRYVALGLTNREIALACGTSPNTVRNQLASVFRKAGVSTRAELVAWSLGALDPR